jgi:hypothetical protein
VKLQNFRGPVMSLVVSRCLDLNPRAAAADAWALQAQLWRHGWGHGLATELVSGAFHVEFFLGDMGVTKYGCLNMWLFWWEHDYDPTWNLGGLPIFRQTQRVYKGANSKIENAKCKHINVVWANGEYMLKPFGGMRREGSCPFCKQLIALDWGFRKRQRWHTRQRSPCKKRRRC